MNDLLMIFAVGAGVLTGAVAITALLSGRVFKRWSRRIPIFTVLACTALVTLGQAQQIHIAESVDFQIIGVIFWLGLATLAWVTLRLMEKIEEYEKEAPSKSVQFKKIHFKSSKRHKEAPPPPRKSRKQKATT